MKKIFVLALAISIAYFSNAQDSTATPPPVKKVRKSNGNSSSNNTASATEIHPADHILIQFGTDVWYNKTSNIKTDGGRFFNFYFMNDKPFKTNPKFSVAYGLGIGSSNIYFNKMYVDIRSKATADSNKAMFNDASGGNHFNKFKLTEIFLEAPVELRYTFNKQTPNKSWKIAVGAKVGLLLKAYTKGKDLQDATGKSIYGATYIQKEYNKTFFNGTRLTLSGRVGYGNFSLYGAHTITSVFKTGFGPELNTTSIGLCISGL